jgi:hypothetical protein
MNTNNYLVLCYSDLNNRLLKVDLIIRFSLELY